MFLGEKITITEEIETDEHDNEDEAQTVINAFNHNEIRSRKTLFGERLCFDLIANYLLYRTRV